MIDYTNKIFEIIDKVQHTITKEMPIPVFMDSHSGNHSIFLSPISDNLIEILGNGQSREYAILISYEMKVGGKYNQNSFKQVSNTAEHLKRLFAPDNSANEIDYWSGGEIESIEYERDEEDETTIKALLTFKCIGYEVSN